MSSVRRMIGVLSGNEGARGHGNQLRNQGLQSEVWICCVISSKTIDSYRVFCVWSRSVYLQRLINIMLLILTTTLLSSITFSWVLKCKRNIQQLLYIDCYMRYILFRLQDFHICIVYKSLR